ncbi:hypothetical protein AYO45_04425 [Gammaproteobacteria bacterium SCGC AG-212-F23]|nr:hypothetical protein AYO45_04425 [Gammaproteobacteria bacterium SCGC AG-212-F23]
MTASTATPAKKNNVLEEVQTIYAECKAKNAPDRDSIYRRLNTAFIHNNHLNKHRDDKGNLPIHIAANTTCSIHVLEWLLDKNAHTGFLGAHKVNVSDTNGAGETPLMFAVIFKDEKGEDKVDPVILAEQANAKEQNVALMLDLAFPIIPRDMQSDLKKIDTPIFENRRRIELLMEAGASVWEKFNTELFSTVFKIAAAAGNFKFINEHLPLVPQKRWDANRFKDFLSEVLHEAVKYNHLNIVRKILTAESIIGSDRGREILRSAMQLPDQSILKELLKANIPGAQENGSQSHTLAMEAIILSKKEGSTINLPSVLQTISSFLYGQGKTVSYSPADLKIAFKRGWFDVLRDHMQAEIAKYRHTPIATYIKWGERYGSEDEYRDKIRDYTLRPLEAAVKYGDIEIVNFVLSKEPPFLQYENPREAQFLSLILAIERKKIALVKQLLAANPDYDIRQDERFINKLLVNVDQNSADKVLWQIKCYVLARFSAFAGDAATEKSCIYFLEAAHKTDYEKLPRPQKLVNRYASLALPTNVNDSKSDVRISMVSSTAITIAATTTTATTATTSTSTNVSSASIMNAVKVPSTTTTTTDAKQPPLAELETMRTQLLALAKSAATASSGIEESAMQYIINECINNLKREMNPDSAPMFPATKATAVDDEDDVVTRPADWKSFFPAEVQKDPKQFTTAVLELTKKMFLHLQQVNKTDIRENITEHLRMTKVGNLLEEIVSILENKPTKTAQMFSRNFG